MSRGDNERISDIGARIHAARTAELYLVAAESHGHCAPGRQRVTRAFATFLRLLRGAMMKAGGA